MTSNRVSKEHSYALRVMKGLSEEGVNLSTLSYFPLDDRIIKNCKCSSSQLIPMYEELLKTIKKNTIPQTDDHEVLPMGVMPLETVILGTKDGYFYAINQKENTQERLKNYSSMVCSLDPILKMDHFIRVGENFAVLIRPDFKTEKTCFRRASVIGVYDNYAYFIELDTGNLVEIPNDSQFIGDPGQLNLLFEEPSCITEYQLDEMENPTQVLAQLIPIIESKSLDLVGFDYLGCGRWMPLAEVVKQKE